MLTFAGMKLVSLKNCAGFFLIMILISLLLSTIIMAIVSRITNPTRIF